jgi:hypothetical protein
VDAAEHVAAFTPGFTTTVAGDLKGYDAAMQRLAVLSSDMALKHGDSGRVATVTWIGYEAPQWDEIPDPGHSVVSDSAARAGATSLDGFLNGIGAAHDLSGQPLHLTALGHSYGSLTTGLALQQVTPVHDAVVFGSPGLDATSVNALHVPAGHVYVEHDQGDMIADLGAFGNAPDDLTGIGRLSTGAAIGVDGQPLSATHGHSGYLDDASTSQYNMAAVVVGRADLAVPGPPPPPPNPEVVPIPPGMPPPRPPTPSGPPVPAPPGPDPMPPPEPR